MASIRRISNTFENIQSIGAQINPYSPENVKTYMEKLTPAATGLVGQVSEWKERGREIDRIYRADQEERLNGIMTANEMANVERFVEEAYFRLDDEYKNKKAKELAERARALYVTEQIPKVETITEIKVDNLVGGDRKPLQPIKTNVTVIVLKVPKSQSDSAKAWFENLISVLTRDKIFGINNSSEIKNILGTVKPNEEVRVYIEKEYSAIHWKTIKKESPEDIIINNFNYDSLTWDDYPLFQNIENEIFLREKEEEVSIDFINLDAISEVDERQLNYPLNFYKEESEENKPNSEYWPKASKLNNDPDSEFVLFNPNSPFYDLNFSNFLKEDQGNFVIDNFFNKLKALDLINLLKNINNFYKIEGNNFVIGNFSPQSLLNSAIPFIKYKLAKKLQNVLKQETPRTSLKLEKGIFKKLEEENLITNEESRVRVFYIKDEEAGELIPNSRTVMDDYLKKHSISFKQISLSDGVVTLPLEGLRHFFVSAFFGYSLDSFILKRFKNKDFFLKYYYNYVLDDYENQISNKYKVDFKLPRNLIIKTREDSTDSDPIEDNVAARVKRGQDEESVIEVQFNNKNENWLDSDFHCIGYITNREFEDTQLYTEKIITDRITPSQFVMQFEQIDSYNENYQFTFNKLFCTLFHEHINVLQSMGTNFFVRNRNFPDKEALFEDSESIDHALLTSKSLTSLDADQYRFFYLARWILTLLDYEDIATFYESGVFTRGKNYEEHIEFYELKPQINIAGEVDYPTFINNFVLELYDFYKNYKGIFFAEGSSYIGAFLQSLLVEKAFTVGSLRVITEGLASYLTEVVFREKNQSFKLDILDNASHLYFLVSNRKYANYIRIIERLDILASIELNVNFKNIIDIFSDINFSSYIKDDFFKKEEVIDDGIRHKNIFYIYSEIPAFKVVFSNNDRFNLFYDEEMANNTANNFRITYKSVSPTPSIQRAANPPTDQPRRNQTQIQREDPRILETILQTQRLGGELNQLNDQVSRDGNQVRQETSEAINGGTR